MKFKIRDIACANSSYATLGRDYIHNKSFCKLLNENRYFRQFNIQMYTNIFRDVTLLEKLKRLIKW